MKTPDTENLFAICLVAACTHSLGKLWADSCSAVLDAVVINVGNSLQEAGAEAVRVKGLSRGKALQPVTRGGRGL